jgi:hypothetical protein
MARIFESRDLTKEQATLAAKESHDDDPAPLSVQTIPQPDGKFTVIAIYADDKEDDAG